MDQCHIKLSSRKNPPQQYILPLDGNFRGIDCHRLYKTIHLVKVGIELIIFQLSVRFSVFASSQVY